MKQIFSDNIPFFYSWIKRYLICITPNTYCLSSDLYNSLLHKQIIQEFIKSLKPFYLHTPLPCESYKQFIKIIRYICKQNIVTYEYKTKYIRSDYTIEYYLTF